MDLPIKIAWWIFPLGYVSHCQRVWPISIMFRRNFLSWSAHCLWHMSHEKNPVFVGVNTPIAPTNISQYISVQGWFPFLCPQICKIFSLHVTIFNSPTRFVLKHVQHTAFQYVHQRCSTSPRYIGHYWKYEPIISNLSQYLVGGFHSSEKIWTSLGMIHSQLNGQINNVPPTR